MTKSAKSLLVVCSLVLAAVLGSAGEASACTFRCAVVGTGFCLRCVDTGTITNATCLNQGSCGCVFTQNNCGHLASGIQAQPDLAAVVAPAGKNAVCPAPAAESALPATL